MLWPLCLWRVCSKTSPSDTRLLQGGEGARVFCFFNHRQGIRHSRLPLGHPERADSRHKTSAADLLPSRGSPLMPTSAKGPCRTSVSLGLSLQLMVRNKWSADNAVCRVERGWVSRRQGHTNTHTTVRWFLSLGLHRARHAKEGMQPQRRLLKTPPFNNYQNTTLQHTHTHTHT